jgi:hypothetical protein
MIRYLLLFFSFNVYAADNSIYVDQAGDYNTVTITQDGAGHIVNLATGAVLPPNTFGSGITTTTTPYGSDNNYIAITQQGTGAKTSNVEIPNGYNNGISIYQDGAGNHLANIRNLVGNANNISISQTGNGNHSMYINGAPGTDNSGNTINTIQSGGIGADKSFSLTLNGTSSAGVTIQQTNPTLSNSGSMSINCSTGSCGSYSYVRQ